MRPFHLTFVGLRGGACAPGKGLSDPEIVDQIVTFLLAGHETAANTLSWALHLLSQNPEVQVCILQ